MKMQYFYPKQDGFYGVYYPNPIPSHKAFIAMLGDSSDDRMVVSGVKWLQRDMAGAAAPLSALCLSPSTVLAASYGGFQNRRRQDCQP